MIDNNSKEFIYRHIGPSEEEQKTMLKAVGYSSLEDLMENTVPEKILLKNELKISDSLSENDALKKLKSISKQNKIFRNFIGMGYYNSFTPNVILRNILENPGWYTSYTPYQPEVAQGRLEMLLNFQQLIIDLTGMDIANASLLDEATAAAEAVGLSQRLDKNDSKKIFVSSSCNPQTIDLIKTRTEPFGLELIIGNEKEDLLNISENIICGVLAYPGTLGDIQDPSESISQIHKKNGKAILICDLLALTRLKTPAELGADIAVGSAQRFGIPMGYGGPHAAFFATKEEFKRSMPGRIIGVSVDRHGKKAYRLSLQTREQHIRRDKATSNICTAQALLAIISAAFAIYHGPKGILKIANRTSTLAKLFAEEIKSEFKILSENFFDTVTIKTKNKTESIFKKALDENINLRNPDEFAPLWVTDFPLLEWDEESKKYHAMHHPFTSPKIEDIKLLETNPKEVKANAYDLVLNGNEIGGGSIRIHDKNIQSLMFKYLGFSKEESESQFGFLMNAFEYGAPPHGGIALGLDRLVAILDGSESIKDYIAFPKNNSGKDIMIDAPSALNKEQLEELCLALKEQSD